MPVRPLFLAHQLRLLIILSIALLWTIGLGHHVAAQERSGLGAYDGPNITIDATNGRVLSANRPFDAWYPASTTKLMTAYVVFDAIRAGRVTMQSPVTITANAAAQPPSRAGLSVGQVLTVEAALRVLMVKSANDIAVALAESVAGSEPAFINQMNQAARAIGMERTIFTNPHGLPDHGQVTTAYDLGLLTLALWHGYPEHRDFYSMGAVQLGQTSWTNHNLLLQRDRGAIGFKTGYICDSGFNLVGGAQRGGRTLITVVLGARSGLERAAATGHLLDDGFRRAGGLFGEAGQPVQSYSPSGTVQTQATRLRPIVCQSPRVRPTFDEIAAQFGTAQPAFASAGVSASALSGDASGIVLPGGSSDGENDGAGEIDILDVMLGPVIRQPVAVRVALGGATGPAVSPVGRWLVPNPVARSAAAATVPVQTPTAQSPVAQALQAVGQTALPGQIAPTSAGPAVQLAPPSATTASAVPTTVGQAVNRPVPAPIPRPY
ncbi:MAG: hypothetical protein Rhims3KO_12900 [Hyphomicrobiales bacterium]